MFGFHLMMVFNDDVDTDEVKVFGGVKCDGVNIIIPQ